MIVKQAWAAADTHTLWRAFLAFNLALQDLAAMSMEELEAELARRRAAAGGIEKRA